MSADLPDIELRADSAPAVSPDVGEGERTLAWRGDLLARHPDEFRHGYLTGNSGERQAYSDDAGYPAGFHTWPLERRNAWYTGWNLGNVEREP
jgi:hypothetical protein